MTILNEQPSAHRMKILFVSQYFHPEPFSNNDIAKALVERGHDVEVVTCVPNYPEGQFYSGHSNRDRRVEEWEGVRILRAWTIARGEGAFRLLFNYVTYPIAALAMLARHGNGPYSVSFTSLTSPIFQCIVALIMKKFRRVPAVYWIQDIWPDSLTETLKLKNRLVNRLLLSFCSYLYRAADMVLVQSEAFRPKLEAMGVDPERIAFFPNTATGDFKPIPRCAVDQTIAAILPHAPLRLIFAGNVGESQNLDIILMAASALRDKYAIQWVIVGAGRDLARVQAAVISAGLDDVVIFAGRHPMSSMPSFYALADAMIISLKETEIFRLTVPYKLQGYLSAGRPILGSISGEARRIIEIAEVGFCADAEDVEGFCMAVENFAALSPAEREVMSRNARAYFSEHYDASKVFDGLEAQLLSKSKGV